MAVPATTAQTNLPASAVKFVRERNDLSVAGWQVDKLEPRPNNRTETNRAHMAANATYYGGFQ